ncbi:MAG: DJ-1/PfpI family protein [Ruminococcaceae bacterium]|nr:DJ-1/PfpI family protein [Oscillospiraceae bacterium]
MVYMFLGDGFEEIEAVAVIDILRRCGVALKTVSVMGNTEALGAHGIRVRTDAMIEDITDDAQMYILPGGTLGVENLSKSKKLCDILSATDAKIAAICAAPTLLASLGLLDGKKAVCYPSLISELKDAVVADGCVVIDGNFITSKGPGTSFDFGFALAYALCDKTTVDKVKNGMLI